jgi:P-type Mg2+ transporter
MTSEQASVVLKKHGHNLLTSERPQSAWSLFWIAVVNPFNALLIILAIISIATGDKATFSVMMSMVVASTGLRSVSRLLSFKKNRVWLIIRARFWQDLKSVAQASKLLRCVTTNVHVLRQTADGVSADIEIDRKDVVPGDILLFTSALVIASSSTPLLSLHWF